MKDIHVKFAGLEPLPYDGSITIIYIPDQRQVLEPGRKYRIVIDGFTLAGSKPGVSKSPVDAVGMTLDGEPLIKRKLKQQ